MEPLEVKGKWWLPEKPDHKIAGILRFDGIELPTLELFGAFNESGNRFLEADIIWGISSNAKPITLYHCFTISIPSSMSSAYPEVQIYSTLLAHTIFVGDHFDKVDNISFRFMRIEFFNLFEWARISDHQWHIGENGIIVDPPKEAHANVGDMVISIRHKFNPSYQLSKFAIEQTTSATIETQEPKSFIELRNTIHKLRQFLTLAIGQATYPVRIEASLSTDEFPISIFYVPSGDKDALQAKPLLSFRMLFKLEDIYDDFEDYLNAWFSNEEILAPVHELYTAILFRQGGYLEQKFLYLAQALETYHRRRRDRQYVDRATFKTVYKALISAIPVGTSEELIKRIKESLPYVNQLTLMTRLTELATEHHDVITLLFASDDKIESFIDEVKATRNYFTHYEARKDNERPDGETLFHLIAQLRFFSETCLLTELGMPVDKIKELMERKLKNGT